MRIVRSCLDSRLSLAWQAWGFWCLHDDALLANVFVAAGQINSTINANAQTLLISCFLGQTFRPKKKFEPGTLRYSLHKQAEASLKSGLNLSTAVRLPPGEDLNDWIAVHVVDFFNRINLIYGTITEFCTAETCPRMSGGAKYVLIADVIADNSTGILILLMKMHVVHSIPSFSQPFFLTRQWIWFWNCFWTSWQANQRKKKRGKRSYLQQRSCSVRGP